MYGINSIMRLGLDNGISDTGLAIDGCNKHFTAQWSIYVPPV